MRKEETENRMRRIYARRRLERDPAARAKFGELIEELRVVVGEPADEEAWSVLAAATALAIEIEPQLPENSVADQLAQAALFDEAFPQTIGWHEALIDALKNIRGLSDENRRFLIQQHLNVIEAIKAKPDATSQARRLKRAVQQIADVTGLSTDELMRMIAIRSFAIRHRCRSDCSVFLL